MKINKKYPAYGALFYMYISVIIFLAGFTRIYFSIPTILIIIYFTFNFCKEIGRDEQEYISFHPLVFIAVAGIVVVMCFALGFGAVFPQPGDWFKHNAVLSDLVHRPWPVYYTTKENTMLTYYIGQYMVSALAGKLIPDVKTANMTMTLWGMLGVFIVYLNMAYAVKANTAIKQLAAAVGMFFFCGALPLTQIVLSGIFKDEMYSMGSYHWILVKGIMLQYRSNYVMLSWVFPQVIVPWMVMLLLISYRDKIRYLGLVIIPVLLFASFSFVAFVIIAIGIITGYLFNHKLILKEKLCNIFSGCNIAISFTLGLILFFYFLGNIQVGKPYSTSFRLQDYRGREWLVYIVFCFFGFGIYALCTFWDRKKDLLFYLNTGLLLIIPFFRMGLVNDLVMSSSIPSLFYFCVAVLSLLLGEKRKSFRGGVAVVIMLVGAWYPTMELTDNIRNNSKGMEIIYTYGTMEEFTDRNSTNYTEDLIYNYYTYDLDGKIFYEYIARQQPKDQV